MKSLLFFVVFFFCSTVLVQAQSKINLSGKWILDVKTDMGNGTPTLTLVQAGEKLTGSYSGSLGEAPLTGTLKGDIIHIEFSIEGNQIHYDGKATMDQLEGKVDLAGIAKGTFVGKRKE